ncbi:MAG: protein kinase [bacterium]
MNELPGISNYILLRLIGAGAYGNVYLAKSPSGEPCAVKVVFRDRCKDAEHFQREQRAVQFFTRNTEKLQGMIAVTDLGSDEAHGIFWYAMPLADDLSHSREPTAETYQPDTLRARLDARIALPVKDCIALGVELADTLDRLHSRGLLHRDIKPNNVLFIKGKPVIADIGLVIRSGEAASIVGSLDYVPPENHGSYAGDVYSLGKLLYVAVSGRAASDYPGAPRKEADVKDPRFSSLLKIIYTACAEDTRQRYPSAASLLEDLAHLTPPHGGKAIASLVLGIIGVFTWFAAWLILPLSIVGIVLGLKGRMSNKKRRAMAGIILNSIALFLSVVWIGVSSWMVKRYLDKIDPIDNTRSSMETTNNPSLGDKTGNSPSSSNFPDMYQQMGDAMKQDMIDMIQTSLSDSNKTETGTSNREQR